jgi:hypothetical protein
MIANQLPQTPEFHKRVAMRWLEDAREAGLQFQYLKRRYGAHPDMPRLRIKAIRCLAQAGRSMAASMPRYRR